MPRSMTAFGRARLANPAGDKDVTVEIKSVNSRFLDLSVKLPRYISYLEDKIRTYLTANGIVRGKVEVYISVDILKDTTSTVQLDSAAAESYITALRALRDQFGLPDDISVMSVAQNRDLFRTVRPEDDGERDFDDIRPALDEAIAMFCRRREDEGAALVADLRKKAERIASLAGQVKDMSEGEIAGYREKLYNRIKKILDEAALEIAEGRILTEAAVYADRVSIDEEIVRLGSHLAALEDIVSSDEPAGRKLDFLVQEMNREVNTIGSKANNTEISHLVVEMKNELEKIREQIQNIE
ncbi:MAG: YicC family protein [Clostridia bacterium]|nr:YicC family protein [Clostridia bacterium]